MYDIPGKIISLILCFVMLVIAPLVLVAASEDMVSRRSALNDVTNFIDDVIDTKTITDEQLAAFNLSMSSHGLLLDVTVTREKKVTEPDPDNPGSSYTRYIPVENISKFDTGDIVRVSVKQIGYNGRQRLLRQTVRFTTPKFSFSLAGRVR